MIRRSPRHKGVYQRCRDDCPTDRCREHRWAYAVELPARSDGKRRQVTKGGFETAKEAAAARAEVIRKDRAGELATDAKKTLKEWLPEWLAARVEREEIGDNTEHAYRSAIDVHLIPWLGHFRLAELRGLDITRAYEVMVRERREAIEKAKARNAAYAGEAERINAQRRARGLRPIAAKRVGVPRTLGSVSIERIHACLSAALKSAVKQGLIPSSPASNAELTRSKRRKAVPPAPEQYGAFLDAVEQDRLYALWLLLGYSGLRRGEACGLKWEDIDLVTGRMVVRRERVSVNHRVIEKEAKTDAGQERIVFLDLDAVAALKAWRKQQLAERLAWGPAYQQAGDYIFTMENGEPLHPNHVTKRFGRLAKKYGMEGTTPHKLRHFRASALISSGADISAVSKTLGHKNISVTSDIYGHLFEKAAEEVSRAAAGFVPRRSQTA